jgi:hypothetical protein
MRRMIAVAMVVLFIGPAYSQSGPSSDSSFGPPIGTPSKNRDEKRKLDPKQVDADYKATMRQIPNRNIALDPWQSLRTEKK